MDMPNTNLPPPVEPSIPVVLAQQDARITILETSVEGMRGQIGAIQSQNGEIKGMLTLLNDRVSLLVSLNDKESGRREERDRMMRQHESEAASRSNWIRSFIPLATTSLLTLFAAAFIYFVQGIQSGRIP